VLHAFHSGRTHKARAPGTKPGAAAERPSPRRYWCAACATRVTDEDAAIEAAGAHRHRFVNPAGAVFAIGCFASAGCTVDGEPTDEFTWFPGYAWSYAACANCREHLGWCYESAGGLRFFGLILQRLMGPI
jgi:hypothetical protein